VPGLSEFSSLSARGCKPYSGVLHLQGQPLHLGMPQEVCINQVTTVAVDSAGPQLAGDDIASSVGGAAVGHSSALSPKVAVAGRLQACLEAWVDIGASEQVLAWIQSSVPVALWGPPPTIGRQWLFSESQLHWLDIELPQLVCAGSVLDLGVSLLQLDEIDVVSPVHLTPKKGPKLAACAQSLWRQ
jgi:hypothetical protein